MEPEILFENDDVLVVNKPYGWLTHEDGIERVEELPTVVAWFLRRIPEATGVGESGVNHKGKALDRSGIVHRLDRETSGVLILAKTQVAHQALKAQFHDRLAKKEYRAFVYGRMHERWGSVNRPIGRSVNDFRKRSAEPGAKGTLRDAVTDWERIGTGEYLGESFSYIKLLPKTGRTHQLRVHMRSIDRPIVGDELYADYKIATSNNLELNRLALHAHILELQLPHGENQRLIAPIPEVFERAADYIAEE